MDVINDPRLNKSTAFTEEERDRLGLRGLLPARVTGQDRQIQRVLLGLRRKSEDIERYIALLSLQGRSERLFYRTLIEHIEEIMPLVYTPTVGQACREFAHIFKKPRGFYITPNDRGRIRSLLDNWPERDVRVIVVTDGERILGLGDLGANGMGIPIGKLSLYTACAGIHPRHCLPVQLDVGTNNRALLEDPLYLGVLEERVTGEAYVDLVDEFVDAVVDAYPDALIQFEDFVTANAISLLARYRDRARCFNDDIQGTAAVALAGIHAATRITGHAYRDLRILFLGAGSAATGIADLMTEAFVAEGLSRAEARRRLWFVDSRGLVVAGRRVVAVHKRPYAHDHDETDLSGALNSIRPHALIGATGQPGTFTEAIVRKMAALNDRPIVFALSNPTSRAECTAEEAYRWSDGRVVFASGSPFPAVRTESGDTWQSGQGNNVYIFPGVGLGVMGARARRVTDAMFLVAARALAETVTDAHLARGSVYPSLPDIRSVSLDIATKVAERAYAEGIADEPRPASIRDHLAGLMYDARYEDES